MRLALTSVLLLMTTGGHEGCKARVVRNADQEEPDSRTCITSKEYKSRKAEVYRCQLRLQLAGFTDRARVQSCFELGCTLQPPEPGSAPSASTVSTTLLLMTTMVTVMNIPTIPMVMVQVTITFIVFVPPTEAIGMEELNGAMQEEGMDATMEPELEERIREVNESLIYNLAKLEETEDRVTALNETFMIWTEEKFAILNNLTELQDTIMKIQEMMMMEATDVESGVEVNHNTTLVGNDTNTTRSGNDDKPDNFTLMSAGVWPGNMERESKWYDVFMDEGRVVAYITLFMASTALLVGFVLVYKLKDLP